jgi:hypothetical protein
MTDLDFPLFDADNHYDEPRDATTRFAEPKHRHLAIRVDDDDRGRARVGYPGPRHAGGGYTPERMIGEAPIRTVWGGVPGEES